MRSEHQTRRRYESSVRSPSLIGASFMLASRRAIRPLGANSQSWLP
jgi:hypothetical protein